MLVKKKSVFIVGLAGLMLASVGFNAYAASSD